MPCFELRPHEVLTAAAVIAFAAVTEMPDITLAVESHGRAAGAAGEEYFSHDWLVHRGLSLPHPPAGGGKR